MTRSLIVAMTADLVIGRGNELPWRLPADLARFKRLTLGHHLLVGRKTFESIGRPLPGRRMVVITRRGDYRPEGVTVAGSIGAALEVAERSGDGEAFIGGGGEIFRESIELADRVYVTWVHASIEGDTLFPGTDFSTWSEVEREHHDADGRNEHPFTFVTYIRSR